MFGKTQMAPGQLGRQRRRRLSHRRVAVGCGRSLRRPRDASLPLRPFSSQSLDAVADQRRLVRDLAEAVPATARRQQQQQQDHEDQGADGDQGVGQHPEDGCLQHAAGAVGRHVGGREGPRDLGERQPAAGCKEQMRRPASERRSRRNSWRVPGRGGARPHLRRC